MSERWRRFAVVTIKRTRADYVVDAADERDAWNRVVAHEEGVTQTFDLQPIRVTVKREPMLIEHERFVVEVPDAR